MSNFCVVLVSPRDPNNIGACARAMANFGLSDLRVVNPFAPVWREATSAVGANDIMKNAAQLDSLDEPQLLSRVCCSSSFLYGLNHMET